MRFANRQYITTNPYEDALELTKKVKQKAEKLMNIAMALQLQLQLQFLKEEKIHFGTIEEPFSEMTCTLEELADLIGWDENALVNDILSVLQP